MLCLELRDPSRKKALSGPGDPHVVYPELIYVRGVSIDD
jgi:hypothetical protein